jgi:glyoxylase-like metal-dependent hydrolase (beta-lactamase superfamily II)
VTVPTDQIAGVQRRRVGDAVVTAVNDGFVLLPPEVLNGVDPAERDAIYHSAGRRPPFASAINAFLVQWPGSTLLIDAGSGTMMGPGAGRVPENLRAAGVAPEDVDVVVMSHLHPDHGGGLLDQEGASLYPCARLSIAAAELDYWCDASNRTSSPAETIDSFELAEHVIDAYGGRLDAFDVADDAVAGMAPISLPGHTPGHTGYVLRSRGEELVVWGDVCHAPEVQCARPEVTVVFDVDPERAVKDRLWMLARAADDDLLVTGGHMTFPGFSRVARRDGGFILHPDPWQYQLVSEPSRLPIPSGGR